MESDKSVATCYKAAHFIPSRTGLFLRLPRPCHYYGENEKLVLQEPIALFCIFPKESSLRLGKDEVLTFLCQSVAQRIYCLQNNLRWSRKTNQKTELFLQKSNHPRNTVLGSNVHALHVFPLQRSKDEQVQRFPIPLHGR